MIHDPTKLKLGKRAPRHDVRTLKLSNYTAALPLVAPKRVDWSLGVNTWPMFLNDRKGCCTVTTLGHFVLAWSTANGTPIVLTDDDIERAYRDITGYDGTPETDNGAVVLDVLNYARQVGIGGHKIDGFVAVNPQNRAHMDLGIYLFGGVYLGSALPVSAQGQEVWSVPEGGAFGDGKPGSWGGHAHAEFNATPTGYAGPTWAGMKDKTREWAATYYDEAYILLSKDWVSRAKASPGLIDYETLAADLGLLAG
jgi:hypothetical protein